MTQTAHKVILRWNEARQQWDMIEKGKLIQEFFPCVKFGRYFPSCDKMVDNVFDLIIVKRP